MDIIAVDDETPALTLLTRTLGEALPSARIHGFKNAEAALSFARVNSCEIAFLDVELADMDGVWLARQLKTMNPKINIVFVTAYLEYMKDAFSIHASGYVMKPVSKEMICKEIENLRHPVEPRKERTRLRVQTFGNFEVFLDGKPVRFRYTKTKELFAYLVDRHGAFCTNGEIEGILWENQEDEVRHRSYLKKLRMDLLNVFKAAGCGDVIIKQRGGLAVAPDQIDCDYIGWLKGDPLAINAYKGEYMSQYSWGEVTLAGIESAVRR